MRFWAILGALIMLSGTSWAQEGGGPPPGDFRPQFIENDFSSQATVINEGPVFADGDGSATKAGIQTETNVAVNNNESKRASSAAALYLGSGCANEGVSGQGVQFGAAVGGESRDCKAMRLAAAWESSLCDQRAGSGPCTILARELESFNAEYYGGWWFGSLLRGVKNHLLNPIFQLIPWIGQGA